MINNLHWRLPLKIHVYTKSLWTHGSHIRHCHPHSPAPSHTSTSGGYTLQTHYTWTLLYSLKWGENINHLICWLIICNVIMNYHCVTLNASCLMWFRGWTFTWSQFKLLKGKLFIIRRVIFQWLMKIDQFVWEAYFHGKMIFLKISLISLESFKGHKYDV